jgi:2-keto-3-deoxy-L-rhamnonate aldolase RhmA
MKTFNHQQSLLKSKMDSKTLTLGSWLTIPHQSIVEILASAGFEWLVLDLEHSAIDFQKTQEMMGHIQAQGMQGLVRVSSNEPVVIKRSMDIGADGVIVPMVLNQHEAQKAVDAVRYPPLGNRGVGLSRAQHYGIGFETYNEWVNSQSVVIIQVEHIDAVNNLESILGVEGVDGIIVGPYDLSASLGKPGQFNAPEVVEALNRVEEISSKYNKSLGFHVIKPSHSEVTAKVKKGYTFIAFSLDFLFLGDKARKEMKSIMHKQK